MGNSYTGRVGKISEKLQSIQVGVENERFQKLENAEHRLVQAEEQFNEFQEFIFSKFKAVQDQLARVSKGLDDDRVAKEQAYDVKNKDQANLEVRFLNAIENEQSVRKDIEAKLVRAVEDKAALTKTELQKVVKARVDGIEQIHAGLSNDLPKIQDAIRDETQERDEADSTVMKSITDELTKISNGILNERRCREESEQSIFDMLKDVVNRVKVELDQERQQREETEENLFGLLEDTCNKLSVAANL